MILCSTCAKRPARAKSPICAPCYKKDWCRRNPEAYSRQRARMVAQRKERRAHYNAYAKRYRAKNPEWFAAYEKRRNVQHREKRKALARRGNLRRKYGLTEEALAAMLQAQGGHCVFCSESEKLHIDHDHKTARIRGILCSRHNMLLGHVEVNLADIPRMIEYLGRPRPEAP